MRAKAASLSVVTWTVIVLTGTGWAAPMEAYEGPRDVRPARAVEFAARPVAVKVGGKVKITFAVSATVELAFTEKGRRVTKRLEAIVNDTQTAAPMKPRAWRCTRELSRIIAAPYRGDPGLLNGGDPRPKGITATTRWSTARPSRERPWK